MTDYPTNRALGRVNPNNHDQSKAVSLGLGRLLQLPVLRFRSEEDRNIRIGVFPQCKEIFVGGERPDAAASARLSKLCMPCIIHLSIQNETSVSSNRVESPDFIAVLK